MGGDGGVGGGGGDGGVGGGGGDGDGGGGDGGGGGGGGGGGDGGGGGGLHSALHDPKTKLTDDGLASIVRTRLKYRPYF